MNRITKERQEQEINPVTNRETTQTGLFARQPASVPGRIAFWASVVGFLAGLGGAIALTSQGSQGQDLIITTVFWLAIAVILVTRFRWAPVVTTLLSGYLLYRIFTEPYVLASLTNPKGPDGGFGKFIGMVFTVAFALLVLAGSIGAVIQNYRQGSRRTPRWIPLALCLVAGMVIGAVVIGAISQPPTETTNTSGVPTVHMSANAFLQSSVTLAKGSKLLLMDDTSVMHDLFNGVWQNGVPKVQREAGAPVVNGVQVSGNSVTIGPFATAGTYHIFCTIHPGMMLTIIVQ
jgi:plastocyanin